MRKSQESHTLFMVNAFFLLFVPPQFPDDSGRAPAHSSLTGDSTTGANVGKILQAMSHTHVLTHSPAAQICL